MNKVRSYTSCDLSQKKQEEEERSNASCGSFDFYSLIFTSDQTVCGLWASDAGKNAYFQPT